jgi:two-component system response regulator DesR
MIRVLVAEDQNLIRGALVALLSLEPDISVVAETARGDTILAEIDRSRPDVAVLDVNLPGMDGIVAAERLKQANSPVRVLVLTSVGTPGTFDRAMRAGVSGFLVKDAPSDRLSRAIRDAYAGRRMIDIEMAGSTQSPPSIPMAGSRGPLSARERGILSALHDGTPIHSLRFALGLSESTLRAHLAAAQSKTGTRNAMDAAQVADDNGWL